MNTVPLIIIVVAALASVVSAGFAVYTYLRGERAKSWPTSQGKVIRSGVRQQTSTDSDGRNSVSYFPDVEYSYSVNGAPQSSERIVVGATTSQSQESAAAVAARYPLHEKVTVYYDPNDPSYGVLQAGAPSMTLLAFGAGAVFSASIAGYVYFNLLRPAP